MNSSENGTTGAWFPAQKVISACAAELGVYQTKKDALKTEIANKYKTVLGKKTVDDTKTALDANPTVEWKRTNMLGDARLARISVLLNLANACKLYSTNKEIFLSVSDFVLISGSI